MTTQAEQDRIDQALEAAERARKGPGVKPPSNEDLVKALRKGPQPQVSPEVVDLKARRQLPPNPAKDDPSIDLNKFM